MIAAFAHSEHNARYAIVVVVAISSELPIDEYVVASVDVGISTFVLLAVAHWSY